MGNTSGLLSDLQLRRWIRSGEPLAKSDGDGLTFTVSAAGCATWVLRYRHGNRRCELSLGRYPDIGLSEARRMAAVKRVDILKGANPAAEKRKAKAVVAKDWTVRRLILDYREKVLVNMAKSTRVCYSRHLKRIENRLGSLAVREVEAGDIAVLIEESKLTWGESNLRLPLEIGAHSRSSGGRLMLRRQPALLELHWAQIAQRGM
jgi:hypothetical protein